MPRARNFGKARLREKRLDRLAVFGLDIVRGPPREEQGRPLELPAHIIGPADDLGHLSLERVEVQPPASSGHVERLGEEALQGALYPGCGQLRFGVRAAFDLGEVHAPHGVDEHLLCVAIGDGRDIGDDHPAQQLGPGQRQHHHRLAAHGVTADVHRAAQMRDNLGQILRHLGIAMGVVMRAAAVVAHVHRDDVAIVRKTFRDDAPVAARAIEAMNDKQGRTVGDGFAIFGVIQHAVKLRALQPGDQSD